jgi:copper chaperone CopZ
MRTARFAVEGMSCGACVRGVTAIPKRLDGVEVQQVSVGAAEVSFDPTKTSSSAIAETLTQAGYPAQQGQPT